MLLAGCVANAPAPTVSPGEPTPDATQAEPSPSLLDLVSAPRQVNRVSAGGEPLILADIKGKHLWIADTSGVYYSSDNGTRWQRTTGYLGDFPLAFTDGPGLAQDAQGRLYKAVLHDNRLDVARSDDGQHFNHVSYLAGYPIDRPWIAVRDNSVVVIYLNNFGLYGVGEACTRSTDAGATFTDRNPYAANPGAGGMYMAPDKSFYIPTSSGQLVRQAQACAGLLGTDTKQMLSASGVNNLIAASGYDSKVFMAAAGSGNQMQVAGIKTWSGRPLVYTVSPPELKTNTFGAVAAHGNDVAVAWYGSTSSGDPSATGFSGSFDVYLALIKDYFAEQGEPTIQLWKVSEKPNHKGQICMGGVTCTGNRGLLDYFGVAFDNWGGLHVAYVDDTSSTTTYHAHVVPQAEGTPIGQPQPPPIMSAVAPSGSTPPGSGKGPVPRIHGEIQGMTVRLSGEGSTGTPPLSFAWDLGDGTHAEGAVINHTYENPGEYKVRLTVQDGQAREASTTATVHAKDGASGGVSSGGRSSTPGPSLIAALAVVAACVYVLRRRD